MGIVLFQITVVAKAALTVIRRAVGYALISEDVHQDSLTAPQKRFSTGPPFHAASAGA